MLERIDPDNQLEGTPYHKHLMCPEKGSLILKGSETSNPFKFINIRLKPNINFLTNFITSDLSNAMFTLITAGRMLDLNSFTRPIKPFIDYSNRIFLRKDHCYRQYIYLRENKAKFYDNLFFFWEGRSEIYYSVSKTVMDSYN